MLLMSLCLGLQLYGQDTLAVKGTLADTLTIKSATVTGQTQANRIEGGAYAASAVSIRQQAASLQTISQAIEYSPGIIIKPVVNAYYSKNDYTMRGVKVRKEDHTAFVYKDLPRFHDGYLSLFALLCNLIARMPGFEGALPDSVTALIGAPVVAAVFLNAEKKTPENETYRYYSC